ncbi:Uma2 family endonuclease [Spirulina sp. CS-785/01]|uniref:Uma2 family endonuclease n=1 Tax=Spirulina sp. CS-785/01 TaxID=3021716 RepID=UPI00232B7FFA|nr:Uma2 family endonuclease [Spirulina sp. CS-785/01]MDB9315475.1 Uma2 family endonuclease [Spirulina sp. CS-785/01]
MSICLTGSLLANGAIGSPDTAWVKRDRINALNPDPNQFLPLCPDFVIKLRSSQSVQDNPILNGKLT